MGRSPRDPRCAPAAARGGLASWRRPLRELDPQLHLSPGDELSHAVGAPDQLERLVPAEHDAVLEDDRPSSSSRRLNSFTRTRLVALARSGVARPPCA